MSNKPNLPLLSKKLKKDFYKISGLAIANKKYRWGITSLEKYAKHYSLNENEKYKLGLLYDHLAMEIKFLKKNKKHKRHLLINKYLKKAEEIYKDILKENPKYFHALYGIGRIYGIYDQYDKALSYQIKAFKQMLKLPRKQRGALAIGAPYQQKGDYKNAEKWYLKEYRACPKNDFGTNLNLFSFYKTTKNYKKALLYGLEVERLAKKEFNKKIYKGLKMNKSDFLTSIRKEINDIKMSLTTTNSS